MEIPKKTLADDSVILRKKKILPLVEFKFTLRFGNINLKIVSPPNTA